MHALFLALTHISSTHGLSASHVTISCNNKGILSLVQQPRAYISCSLKHHDLLQAIMNTHCSCPLSLSFHYVASHQDDLIQFEDLPLLAQLNVQADSLEKQALHILGTQQALPILTPLPNAGWTLSIKDLLVSSDPWPLLLNHLSYWLAIPYWIKQGQLTDYSASLIDWPLLDAALSLHPPTYRMWASKFASGHSAVGFTMAQWKRWDSPLCPFCELTNKTTLHILQCPHPHCTTMWHKEVASFHNWLQQANTSPVISQCFVTSLHQQGITPFSVSSCSLATDAASDQSLISFFNMLLGCLSPKWESLQAQYWLDKNSSCSPRLWAKRLCAQLLHLTHSMWITRNQQLQDLTLESLTTLTHLLIQQEFELGIQDLLPNDRFYVLSSTDSEGFSLDRVLAMSLPDQQLWLSAICSARTRGSQLSQAKLLAMQSNFHHWLQPTNPGIP